MPHTWRTRQDPLEAVWEQALAMLREATELEAKAPLVQPASELGQEGAALCQEIAAEGDRFLLGERQLRRIFFWVSALAVTGFVNLVIMLLRLTGRRI